MFARLKPGITVRQAIAELQPPFQRALETVPAQFREEISLRVRPVRDRQVGYARVASLGASRLRVERQALTESLMLSAIGGTLGCALGCVLLRVFVAIAWAALPRLEEIAFSMVLLAGARPLLRSL